MSDLTDINRRAFLMGAGSVVMTSLMLKETQAAPKAKHDYLIISDAVHSNRLGSEKHMAMFNSEARLSAMARQGYRSIALEICHDLPLLMRGGIENVTNHITKYCKDAGLKDQNRWQATANRFIFLADTVLETQAKARKYGIHVTCVDPWSLEKMLKMTLPLTPLNIFAHDKFRQERFSHAFHEEMARRISRAPLSGVIIAGSKHTQDLNKRLGGHNRIVKPEQIASIVIENGSDFAVQSTGLGPRVRPA